MGVQCAYTCWIQEGDAKRMSAYNIANEQCYTTEFPHAQEAINSQGIARLVDQGIENGSHMLFTTGVIALVLLGVLCIMHVYWYALFFRILHGLLTNPDAHETGAATYEGDDG